MARNADIQYIRHDYTRKAHPQKQPTKKRKFQNPFFRLRMLQDGENLIIKVEALPLLTILAAIGLSALMVVNLFHFSQAHQEKVALQEYIYDLRNEQVRLEKIYYEGFDLDEIRVQALALGMIPAEEAEVLPISGEVPEPSVDPTLRERIEEIFRELFAKAP